MKATVCQLETEPSRFPSEWARLVAHVRHERSELLLLPEMPFHPWFFTSRPPDPAVWRAAVAAHDAWLVRLHELRRVTVLASRPVERDGRRLNEGFAWDVARGYRAAHHKRHLPDEAGFWEASWYQRGARDFAAVDCGAARVGFLICTELWFTEHARAYGRGGAHLVVTPRATEAATVDKWLLAGRVAAIVSGAYALSSNHAGPALGGAVVLGGQGFVVDPEGEVLGLTSADRPFVTVEVDLARAERAKRGYPRYVED
jgi:N-carbamoylputrescine amidase